jgi:uncharacterized protein (DUF2141 family)
MYKIILPLLLLISFRSQAQDLTIEFSSNGDQNGDIFVLILDESEETVREIIQPYRGNPTLVRVTGLKAGIYCFRAFHDVNGNGELDTSWIGLPTEPYGFSNNARGRFGPPDIEKQIFEIRDGELNQKIHLH